MALIPCPACSAEVSPHARACPKCGHPIAEAEAGNTSRISQEQRARLLGWTGAGLLALGAFLPVVRAPIIGSFSTMSGEGHFGLLLLFTALTSAVVVSLRRRQLTLGIGVLALVEVLVLFFRIRSGMGEVSGSSGGPLAAAGRAMVQFEYGFLVLLIGAGLLLASGASSATQDDVGASALAAWGQKVRLPSWAKMRPWAVPMALVLTGAAIWYSFLRPGIAEERQSRRAVEKFLRYQRRYYAEHNEYDMHMMSGQRDLRELIYEPDDATGSKLSASADGANGYYGVMAWQVEGPMVTCIGGVTAPDATGPLPSDPSYLNRHVVYDGVVRCGGLLMPDDKDRN